jgi:hypothetical protein
MSNLLGWLVGQAGSLRRLGKPPRRRVNNPPQVDNLPHIGFLASLCLICALPAFCAIDGTVVNQTSGKPQASVLIQLVQPGQGGMQTLATLKTDANGKFQSDVEPRGPTLVQAIYQGVIYNKMIVPGTPSTGLEVAVYDSTKNPAGARVTQHFILLSGTGGDLNVNESYIYRGDPKLSFNDPANGTLHFYVMPGAKDLHVLIQGPAGMPIQREASKTKEPNVYKVDYAVKPGETRFDVNYVIPAATPLVLSGKIVQKEDNVDLVAPVGFTVKGTDLENLGQEPKSQATIYKIKTASYNVEIEGSGSMRQAAEPAAQAPGEDTGMPDLHAVNPRIYDSVFWILGLVAGVLILGSIVLYRSHLPMGAKK